MMKPEESNDPNKTELFEEIKDKCKSRARANFFWSLLAILLVIAGLVFLGVSHDPHEVKDLIFFIVSIVLLGLTGWFALLSYRFYKRIDTLNTPEQLLQYYEKKNRNLKIFFLVFWFFMLGERFARCATDITIDYEYVLLGLAAVAAAYLMFSFSKDDKLSRKDLEIIEQLRELVNKE